MNHMKHLTFMNNNLKKEIILTPVLKLVVKSLQY